MTTRIHIVNFGPDVVEVEIPSVTLRENGQKNAATKIYHDVLVREIQPDHEPLTSTTEIGGGYVGAEITRD